MEVLHWRGEVLEGYFLHLTEIDGVVVECGPRGELDPLPRPYATYTSLADVQEEDATYWELAEVDADPRLMVEEGL